MYNILLVDVHINFLNENRNYCLDSARTGYQFLGFSIFIVIQLPIMM